LSLFAFYSLLFCATHKEKPPNPTMSSTAPVDPRFAATQNQAKYCWTLYNEYLRCTKAKGLKDIECKEIHQMAHSVCPGDWLKDWHELRTEDKWWGFQKAVEGDETPEDDVEGAAATAAAEEEPAKEEEAAAPAAAAAAEEEEEDDDESEDDDDDDEDDDDEEEEPVKPAAKPKKH